MDTKKIINITRIILSLLIVLDVILITYSVVSDISPVLYQKILLFDIIICIILSVISIIVGYIVFTYCEKDFAEVL